MLRHPRDDALRTIMWPWATRTPCDYCSCGADGHITKAGTYRLHPRQSAAPARPAPRHPELVPDEPATAAVQDRRAADPTCPVLHPAACRELLDTAPVLPDYRPHRATRVAPDVIQRTARRRRIDVGGSVPAGGGHERHGLGGCEVSGAGTARASRVTDCEWTASAVRLSWRQSPG